MPVQGQNPNKETLFQHAQSENNKKISNLLEQAQASGNAIWQDPQEERLENMVVPKVVYQKEGQDKTYAPPAKMYLVMLQAQKNMGTKDSCWVSKFDVQQNPEIKLKANAVSVRYTKERKDGSLYLAEFYNRSQLEGKGVPAIEIKPAAKDQMYLHDMIDFMARNEKYNMIQAGTVAFLVERAERAATKEYYKDKERFDLKDLDWEDVKAARLENAKRYDALIAFDLSKPIEKNNDAEIFKHLCAEELRRDPSSLEQSEARSPFARAAARSMKEFDWDKEKSAEALRQIMPSAAIDPLLRDGYPKSVENVMKSAERSLARQAEMEDVRQ